MEQSDWQLLREYIEHGSERAFSQIVAKYIDLVHSAAVRQVRDNQLAEEVTQVVFIVLAKKAKKLGANVILSGWLHKTARFAALNILKTEARRKSHERKAAQMHGESYQVDSSWNHLSPLLDAAVARLSDRDRAAITLRYFQRKTIAEVAAAMSISDDAAAMRISRALDKLRATFSDKGIVLGAVALAGVISTNSVYASPHGLGGTVAANALRSIGAGSAGTFYSADAVIRAMALARAKVAATFLFAILALAAIGSLFTNHLVVPLWHEMFKPNDQHTMLLDNNWHNLRKIPYRVLDYRIDRRFS